MDQPWIDVRRSKLDLHTSNLDLHRSRLDLCRSREKRQIWDFEHFATGKNSSFCVQQRLWNSFFKILSFRGCHFAKNCMKIVNFTLLLGPTWVQRWTYIGPDWTHVGPAWTYIDPSQVYPWLRRLKNVKKALKMKKLSWSRRRLQEDEKVSWRLRKFHEESIYNT